MKWFRSSEKAKTTESTQESVLKSKSNIIDPQGASQLTEVNREKFLMENTELKV